MCLVLSVGEYFGGKLSGCVVITCAVYIRPEMCCIYRRRQTRPPNNQYSYTIYLYKLARQTCPQHQQPKHCHVRELFDIESTLN